MYKIEIKDRLNDFKVVYKSRKSFESDRELKKHLSKLGHSLYYNSDRFLICLNKD